MDEGQGDAVAELEAELSRMVQDHSDLGYDSIDGVMWKISSQHSMDPSELHDQFVAKHNTTPDAWALVLKDKQEHDSMVEQATHLHAQLREHGNATWVAVTRAMIAQGMPRKQVNEAVNTAIALAHK
mgnify:CR=1 FL=1